MVFKQIVFLLIPCSVLAMDLSPQKDGLHPFFKIFDRMNEIDLSKVGYQNKSEYGSLIGYLMTYPLEYWQVPNNSKEQNIIFTWINKLYTHKDDQILQHMVDDIMFRIVMHSALYLAILDLLKIEDKSQKISNIVVYLHFKRQEFLDTQSMQKNKNSWWLPCVIF